MNKDFTYCVANKCYLKKECQRWLGNHIVEGVPLNMIDEKTCIVDDYKLYMEKECK